MRYLHTMIRVRNIDESLAFFKLLGMREVRRMENEKGKFTLIFLAADEDEEPAAASKAPLLELTYNWDSSEQYQGGRNFGHLAYAVNNIYETCAALQAAGVVINRPPRDGHMAFIRTPDGISIELLQSGEALPPQPPWQDMPNTGEW